MGEQEKPFPQIEPATINFFLLFPRSTFTYSITMEKETRDGKS
jgi:hypothetical protein